MAYTAVGGKVYSSIKDLPQYSSINDGDKIIIWSNSRDGAATVDFSDFIIDLEHTTFKSTFSEVINFTGNVEAFVSKATDSIDALEKSVSNLEKTVDEELRPRIQTLEMVAAIILGANSYWKSSTGIEILKDKFLYTGIDKDNGATNDELSEEEKLRERWFYGLMNAVKVYVDKFSSASVNEILNQSKFNYQKTES